MHVLRRMGRIRWIVASAVIAVATVTARTQGADDEGVFTADLIVNQMRVADDGQRLPGRSPAARYRIEHRPGPRAITRLTLLEIERDSAETAAGTVTLDNPFLAVRAELDEAGGLRLYNRRGDRLREPTAADRRLFGIVNPPASVAPDTRAMSARSRIATLLASSSRAGERRAEFVRRFGAPVGRVRGLERYVAERAGGTDEVLVDPLTSLPAEMNTVRAGALVSRVQMDYQPRPDGTLLRRSVRAERALREQPGRVVTTIDVTNVTATSGGAK